MHGAFAGTAGDSAASKMFAQGRQGDRIGKRREPGIKLARHGGKSRGITPAHHGLDRKMTGIGEDHIPRRTSDRAGGSQNGDTPHDRSLRALPAAYRQIATAMATSVTTTTKASRRSSTPP